MAVLLPARLSQVGTVQEIQVFVSPFVETNKFSQVKHATTAQMTTMAVLLVVKIQLKNGFAQVGIELLPQPVSPYVVTDLRSALKPVTTEIKQTAVDVTRLVLES